MLAHASCGIRREAPPEGCAYIKGLLGEGRIQSYSNVKDQHLRLSNKNTPAANHRYAFSKPLIAKHPFYGAEGVPMFLVAPVEASAGGVSPMPYVP